MAIPFLNGADPKRALLFFLSFFIAGLTLHSQVIPLMNAHAHNDYKHTHPLQDALDNGFISIEADIFLHHGKFIVSHLYPVFKKKTLEELYLEPLLKRCRTNGGNIYTKETSLILLIDLKSDAEASLLLLEKILRPYQEILSRTENGQLIRGAVTIVLTGNKPTEALALKKMRFLFIDESLLSNEHPSLLCPLSSTKYSNLLSWKGKGQMPEAEKERLTGAVEQAHLQGKKVRLWASPENEAVWKALLDCGVDLINTDHLVELHDFLEKEKGNK